MKLLNNCVTRKEYPMTKSEFVTKYKNLVTTSICQAYDVDPENDFERADLACYLLTGHRFQDSTVSYEDIVSWWKSLKLETEEDYQTILQNFNVTSTTMSNRIEGVKISYHNTKLLYETGAATNFSGTPQELMLVFNQRLLDAKIIKSLVKKVPISVDLIKEFHKILMHGCYDEVRYAKNERPGKFKIHDYAVGVSEVGAFPDEVEEELESLVQEINTLKHKDVLKCATYFHAMFEYIHPFADGNGRLGRALLNYYLMHHNYPPTVIFEEDKETYYLALEVYDKTESIENFVKFLQEQTVKTWANHITK